MKKRKYLFITLAILIVGGLFMFWKKDKMWALYKGGLKQQEAINRYDEFFAGHSAYYADGFDFPVGKPDAKGYYDAQPFTKNLHLGEDWNGVGGGNSDLGDPIYAVANGYVKYAEDYGSSWGNIVRILHCIPGKPNEYVESFYAHVDTMLVIENTWVKRGDKIATIGDAGGAYPAHLHFELRNKIDMNIGPGYSTDTTGYINPKVFIKKNRPTRGN